MTNKNGRDIVPVYIVRYEGIDGDVRAAHFGWVNDARQFAPGRTLGGKPATVHVQQMSAREARKYGIGSIRKGTVACDE